MRALFASGRIVDLILALVVLEAIAIAVWHRRSGRGPTLSALLPNLCAGAALLLAVRAALVGAWWGWIAAPLLAALLAHVLDLRSRTRDAG
jgi:hypothetical protein